jgi:hypothetical protein
MAAEACPSLRCTTFTDSPCAMKARRRTSECRRQCSPIRERRRRRGDGRRARRRPRRLRVRHPPVRRVATGVTGGLPDEVLRGGGASATAFAQHVPRPGRWHGTRRAAGVGELDRVLRAARPSRSCSRGEPLPGRHGRRGRGVGVRRQQRRDLVGVRDRPRGEGGPRRPTTELPQADQRAPAPRPEVLRGTAPPRRTLTSNCASGLTTSSDRLPVARRDLRPRIPHCLRASPMRVDLRTTR